MTKKRGAVGYVIVRRKALGLKEWLSFNGGEKEKRKKEIIPYSSLLERLIYLKKNDKGKERESLSSKSL